MKQSPTTNDFYVYLHIMIRILILASCLLLSSSALLAQRNIKKNKPTKQAQPISVSIDPQILQTYYKEYNFPALQEAISQLSQSENSEMQKLSRIYAEKLERAERMLEHVEVINLIDKKQIDWSDFDNTLKALSPMLSKYITYTPLANAEAGTTFTSKIGNYYFQITPDNTGKRLVLIDYPQKAKAEITELDSNINTPESIVGFPFLLSDGIRLLFARKDHLGLGGYDLYLSRYNWERKSYLEPTLLGMPFNSPANDYLLAYDESQDKSYLVSDRDCPSGKIHIYIFDGLAKALKEQGEKTDETSLTKSEQIDYARLNLITKSKN